MPSLTRRHGLEVAIVAASVAVGAAVVLAIPRQRPPVEAAAAIAGVVGNTKSKGTRLGFMPVAAAEWRVPPVSDPLLPEWSLTYDCRCRRREVTRCVLGCRHER